MAAGSRPTKPKPLTNEQIYYYSLLEKRLRAPAHEPELHAYGPQEVQRAAEVGAVSALLSIGPVIKPLQRVVKGCGGVILEFRDPASMEYQRLKQLGGVAATLRFEAPLELSSTSDNDELSSAPLSSALGTEAEKPIIEDETSVDARKARGRLSVAQFVEEQGLCDEDNTVTLLNEDAAEEVDSMSAIYPDDFAFLPSTTTCILSINSSNGRKSAVVAVELDQNYPNTTPAKPQHVLQSFGVNEEELLEGARATCDSSVGEPALFELMLFLSDAVNASADSNVRPRP